MLILTLQDACSIRLRHAFGRFATSQVSGGLSQAAQGQCGTRSRIGQIQDSSCQRLVHGSQGSQVPSYPYSGREMESDPVSWPLTDDPWMPGCDAKQSQCRPFWAAPALLPISKRVNADAQSLGKRLLGHPHELSKRQYIVT